jgi:hypothetical protein
MELTIHKVKGGIIQRMYVNNIQCVKTFSKRPYQLSQACDGTIDDCVNALFITFCQHRGLDSEAIYKKAYPEEDSCYDSKYRKKVLVRAAMQGVAFPKIWGEAEIQGLCESLHEINNHQLVAMLVEAVEDQENA